MNEQPDLFDFGLVPSGARARPTDPWTSHAAARSIEVDKLRASQQAVLDCFRRHGAMHHGRLVAVYLADLHEAAWPLQSESGLRTRTSELVTRGLLKDSGQVVVLPSKRRSIVWEPA